MPTHIEKRVFLQTWGCQMNVADSERMLALLKPLRYVPTEVPGDADLVVLNTCHIREKARHKVVSRLGELREIKEANPDMVLAVAGCVAQAEAAILRREAPFVDLIFGPDQIEELPSLLENLLVQKERADKASASSKETVVRTGFTDADYTIPIDVVPPLFDGTHHEASRFVNIIKGCNNFCTFCVVPFTRGRQKSRAREEILQEVRYLADRGVKEVVLLGQNVNSYGLDALFEAESDTPSQSVASLPFAELLYDVAAVRGVERIRFTSSNPHDFTPQLAKAFRDLPALCNAFHLPVQSGSDPILERMNRKYTRSQYLERVGWIRAERPDVAFSTDLIVGFPGETENDFEATLSLVEEMKYAFIYAFKYSPRRGTLAARFRDTVAEEVKDRRLQTLLELQRRETERQNAAEIGCEREVLSLYVNEKDPTTLYGRTSEGRLVKFPAPHELLGRILPIRIVASNPTTLEGRLLA